MDTDVAADACAIFGSSSKKNDETSELAAPQHISFADNLIMDCLTMSPNSTGDEKTDSKITDGASTYLSDDQAQIHTMSLNEMSVTSANDHDFSGINQYEGSITTPGQLSVSEKDSGFVQEPIERDSSLEQGTRFSDELNPETPISNSVLSIINLSDEGYVTLRQSRNELESSESPERESRMVSRFITEKFSFLNEISERNSVPTTNPANLSAIVSQNKESSSEENKEVVDSINPTKPDLIDPPAHGSEEKTIPLSPESVTMRHPVNVEHTDEDEEDGEDDDVEGIYDESYRSSKWVFDAEENEEELTQSKKGLRNSNITETTEDQPITLPGDQINEPMTRTDSMSTTASEYEYRRPYREVSVKRVKRKGSQQTFIRENTAYISADKKVVLTRGSSLQESLGFHVNGSLPTYVSTVVPGSQADKCGMTVGDVIIAINYESVLHLDHDEIVAVLKADCESLTIELCKETSLSTMRKEEELSTTVYSGYMSKLTNSILGIWKKRWFDLKSSDNCLYYYKNKNDAEILGAIPLPEYSMQKALDLKWKKANSLKLVHRTKTYYLATENENEYSNWAQHINTATNQTTRRPSLTGGTLSQPNESTMSDVWMDVSSHNVGLPALSIPNPDCQGFLHKEGGSYKSWKKRYAVLKNGCLYYYRSMESSSAQGVAHLHGYTVECAPLSSKRNAFDLVPPEATMRTFHFYCSTEIEKDRWTCAMMKSIGQWIKISS